MAVIELVIFWSGFLSDYLYLYLNNYMRKNDLIFTTICFIIQKINLAILFYYYLLQIYLTNIIYKEILFSFRPN